MSFKDIKKKGFSTRTLRANPIGRNRWDTRPVYNAFFTLDLPFGVLMISWFQAFVLGAHGLEVTHLSIILCTRFIATFFRDSILLMVKESLVSASFFNLWLRKQVLTGKEVLIFRTIFLIHGTP